LKEQRKQKNLGDSIKTQERQVSEKEQDMSGKANLLEFKNNKLQREKQW